MSEGQCVFLHYRTRTTREQTGIEEYEESQPGLPEGLSRNSEARKHARQHTSKSIHSASHIPSGLSI